MYPHPIETALMFADRHLTHTIRQALRSPWNGTNTEYRIWTEHTEKGFVEMPTGVQYRSLQFAVVNMLGYTAEEMAEYFAGLRVMDNPLADIATVSGYIAHGRSMQEIGFLGMPWPNDIEHVPVSKFLAEATVWTQTQIGRLERGRYNPEPVINA